MSWNVVLIGTLKTGAATTMDVHLSTHAFVTLPTDTPANTYFPALIRSSVTLKKSVSAQSSGGRDASLAIGRVEIDDTEGDLYQWPTYSIEMQPWALYVIPLGRPYSERVLIARFRGRKSPEVVSAGVLGLNFGDRMTLLEKNIGSVYPDTISNTQLRGRPRPLVLGKAWQVPCEQPEITGNDRFEVTDSADFGGVDEVRDNGVLRTPGTQWKPSSEVDIHGYELLTARGGKQAATVTGALTITGTDALGGIGAFASLSGWLYGTSTSVQQQRWSSTDKSTFLSLSNADLDVTHNDPSGVGRCVRLEYPITTGKLYWEIEELTAGTRFVMGLGNKSAPIQSLNLLTTQSYCFAWDTTSGNVYYFGNNFAATPVPSGPFRMAYDADTRTLWIGDSTGWLNGDPATADGGYTFFLYALQLAPGCMLFSNGQKFRLAPNAASFSYTPPTGFDALEGASVAGVVALSGGGCRIASNGDANAQLYASGLTTGAAYTLTAKVLSAVGGTVEFLVDGNVVMSVTAPGNYARAFIAGAGSLQISRAPGVVTDLIIDDVVVLPADSTQFLPGLINFCAARAGLVGGDLDSAAIDALHAAAPYSVGLAVDGGTEIRDVLTLTLDAWLGWCYFNWSDVLTVGRLTRPVIGESVMSFDALTLYGPIVRRIDEAKGMSNLLLARRNWEVFSDSEVPPAITGAERALVTAQYRIIASATPTSDPGFIIGQEPDDRERKKAPGMPTVLIDQGDADTEIVRRVTGIFANRCAFHEFKVLLDVSDLSPCFLELGQQVEVSNAYQSSYEVPVECILLAHEIEFPAGIVGMIGHGAQADPVVVPPEPSDSIFICNFTGADGSTVFIDNAESNPITAYDNAQIQTAGGQHGLFDGTGDYLSVTRGAGWGMPSPFTVEMFVAFDDVERQHGLIGQWEGDEFSTGNAWRIYASATDLAFEISDSGGSYYSYFQSFSPVLGQIHHIAVEVDGSGGVRFYFDGATIYISSLISEMYLGSTLDLTIGRLPPTPGDPINPVELDGRIYGIRIDAFARYATDGFITVPSLPF